MGVANYRHPVGSYRLNYTGVYLSVGRYLQVPLACELIISAKLSLPLSFFGSQPTSLFLICYEQSPRCSIEDLYPLPAFCVGEPHLICCEILPHAGGCLSQVHKVRFISAAACYLSFHKKSSCVCVTA